MTLSALAGAIESTLLSPTTSWAQVEALCREAARAGFHGVCVPPCRVREAVAALGGTAVRVVAVAGFPLGYSTSRAKVAEVGELFSEGAQEVDVVMNVGWFLEGRPARVAEELREARRAAGAGVLKVILETSLLTQPQQREAAAVALDAGADFLKTSTGFGPAGAREEDVALLRQVAGSRAGVKASGGIRTWAQARALLAVGADRLGTSSASRIWEEARAELEGAAAR